MTKGWLLPVSPNTTWCRDRASVGRHHGVVRRRAITTAIGVAIAASCASSADSTPVVDVDDEAPSITLRSADVATSQVEDGENPDDDALESTSEAVTPTVLDVEQTDANEPPVTAAVEPAEAGGDADPAVGDDTEDPSFELGPDVVLDVDVARFPADDAGIGGPQDSPEPGASGEDGQEEAITGWAGVDRYLESVLIRSGNTAASVAVSIDGDVVHRAAFGVRDPATGDPAQPQDRFRIASISKPITAITVMALVDDGVITLDEPLGDVVAQHVGLPAATGGSSNLTFRQLLSHRSGFGKYDSTFFRGAAEDCVEAAQVGLSSGAGGGGYTYSNMNYCIAGLVIEAVTGLTYEQAVYRYLLTPLGISGMRLAPTFDPGPDEVQHVTTTGRNYMETLGAAGAWIATPSDLVMIFDSLDVDSGGFKPLVIESVFQMLIPPGGTLGQRGYGLGVISYGDNRYGHTGTIESTHAMVLNRGDGVIWSITVAGQYPGESTSLERIMNEAFEAGGFVAG